MLVIPLWRRSAARALIAVALIVAVAASGCGGDDEEKLSGSLGAALSYLPKDPALVVVVPTDIERGPLARLEREASGVEGWEKLKDDLRRQIEDDLDFERDIRPQLGNPLAFASAGGDDEHAALQVRSPQQMRRTIERSIRDGDSRRLPAYKGALVIRDEEDGGSDDLEFSALHSSVLLSADSERKIHAAIDRSGGSDNLAAAGDTVTKLKETEDALFQVLGNVQDLMRSGDREDVANARRIPWVAALEDFSVTGFAEGSGARMEFELKSDGRELSERDLPIAPGSETPRAHDSAAPIVIALLDPGQAFRFGEDVLHYVDPQQSRLVELGSAQLRSSLRLDFHDDLFGRITNLSVAIEGRNDASFRAALEQGAGAELSRDLVRAAPFIESAVADQVPEPTLRSSGSGDERVWTLRSRGGRVAARYAVRGDTLVGSIGPGPLPSEDEAGRPLPGSRGALALRLDLERFARIVPPSEDITRETLDVIERLGTFALAVEADTDRVEGIARLDLDGGR